MTAPFVATTNIVMESMVLRVSVTAVTATTVDDVLFACGNQLQRWSPSADLAGQEDKKRTSAASLFQDSTSSIHKIVPLVG